MIGWEYGPRQRGLGEIDGLLVLPGKASKLLTDHLITGKPLSLSLSRKSGLVESAMHNNRIGLLMKHILSVMAS